MHPLHDIEQDLAGMQMNPGRHKKDKQVLKLNWKSESATDQTVIVSSDDVRDVRHL